MLKHLQAISQAVPKGRHAVLVLNQAAWIKIFENLTLIPLPPASPELNPAPQLWQQLRDNWLANRCFENYETIVDSCCEAWNWQEKDPRFNDQPLDALYEFIRVYKVMLIIF